MSGGLSAHLAANKQIRKHTERKLSKVKGMSACTLESTQGSLNPYTVVFGYQFPLKIGFPIVVKIKKQLILAKKSWLMELVSNITFSYNFRDPTK